MNASVLPASMQQRKARLLAQLGTTDDTPPPSTTEPTSEAPVVEQVVNSDALSNLGDDPPPSTQVETPPPDKDWKAEYDKMEQRYRSLQGVIDSKQRENEQIRGAFADLQEQVDKLKQDLSKKQVADKIAPIDFENLPDLTEEEQRIYAESAPVISKLSRKEALTVIREVIQPLAAELAELKKGQTEVGNRATETEEALFIDSVKRAVPQMPEKVKHPEWGNFLAKKAPFSRATYRELLQQAHNARDMDTIVEIFDAFRPQVPGNGSALSAPASTGAARPPVKPGQKPILKLSDRKKASDDFRMGRIDFKKLQEIQKQFAEAEAEGRLDLTA